MAASFSIRDLYVNVDSRSLTDSNGKTLLLPTMVELFKTQALYRFTLKDAAGNAFAIESGTTFYFAVSNTAGDDDSDLVTSDNDQFNISGDWTAASLTDGKICARVNFNTSNLDTALTTSAEITTPRGELWMTPPGGNPTPLLQFQFTIRNIWTSVGNPPGAAGLTYLTQAAYEAAIAQMLRVDPVTGDTWACKAGVPINNLTGTEPWQG